MFSRGEEKSYGKSILSSQRSAFFLDKNRKIPEDKYVTRESLTLLQKSGWNEGILTALSSDAEVRPCPPDFSIDRYYRRRERSKAPPNLVSHLSI
jgi:hypothetical protein